MAEYQLYCFAQSGNAYRAALMLNLIGADWAPVFVDFFGKACSAHAGVPRRGQRDGRSAGARAWRKKLSQSGVILTYLAERSGKFQPQGEDERLEALRWIIFDNQKVNGYLGPYRFLRRLRQAAGPSGGARIPQGPHRQQARHPRQAPRGRAFLLGAKPTIADLSLVAYLYYPPEEFGFDVAGEHKNIAAWLDRIKALPGWAHPYDLMPGHPLPK